MVALRLGGYVGQTSCVQVTQLLLRKQVEFQLKFRQLSTCLADTPVSTHSELIHTPG